MKRAALLILLLTACSRPEKQPAAPAAGNAASPAGNAERGRMLVSQYGCNVCHLIPRIEGPRGRIGPSLEGVAARDTISEGVVRNTPENLARYIQNPAALNPQSSMPALAVPPQDASDMVAFLMTLK